MSPVKINIPYGRQSIDASDKKAVEKVLGSDWITQGPKIKEFEDSLCRYTGARYAVSVSSGTAALHLACLAAGIRAGDEVIISPLTFIASANCVLYCGGKPVFADVRKNGADIDPHEIAAKITRETRAIIPVHFAGHPCNMSRIRNIARKNSLLVIEDAAHALGAKYYGSNIGSCIYSDMAIFSFHPVKSITTGEGGVVMTNRKDLFEKLIAYRNHGISKENFLGKSHGPWYYEMQHLGYNYRLTDIQAALGISQINKLDRFVALRRKIAAFYDRAFTRNKFFDILSERKGTQSAYHLYPIMIKGASGIEEKRRKMFESLRAGGIGVQVHYIPVHLQPFYQRKFGFKAGDFPRAEDFYSRVISLPIYPALKSAQLHRVVDTVYAVCQKIMEK